MESSLWCRYLLIDLETSDCYDSADLTGHGLFQRKIQILTALSLAIVVGWSRAFTLSSPPVDHWCKPPAHLSHLSEAAWKNVGIPLEANGEPSSCNVFLLLESYDLSNNSADVVACEAWDYDKEHADSSVVSSWNLVCHRAWLLPAAEAMRASGAVFAAIAAGYAADHAGRKPVIIAATTTLLLATFGVSVLNSYSAYVAIGIILSGSAGALFAVTSLLFFELGTHAHRARQLCVAIIIGYAPISVLFMALRQTRLSWSQRQMTMASPTALAPLFYLFVVESPRWLISTKQFNRAEAQIAEAGAANRFGKHAEGVSILKRLRDMAGPKAESLRATLVAVLGITVVRRRAAIVFVSSFVVTFAFHALTATAGLTRAGWSR
ncbi:solute carrier family 22 member 4-like [Amblyomma americanum]